MPAPEQDKAQEWVSPTIRCEFGPYFRSDADEQLKQVQMVQAALGAGKPPGVKLLTDRQALEQIAPIFGIENVDAAMDALAEERQEAEVKQAEQDAAEADDAHKKKLELQKNAPAPVVQAQPGQPIKPVEE